MRCLKLSIIAIKSFCVLYKITMHSFTICIFNENSTFSNNCAFLIKACDIKFSSAFKFIKLFIFRVLKDVTIVIVQIKTRNFHFRNFNFNVMTTNIVTNMLQQIVLLSNFSLIIAINCFVKQLFLDCCNYDLTLNNNFYILLNFFLCIYSLCF